MKTLQRLSTTFALSTLTLINAGCKNQNTQSGTPTRPSKISIPMSVEILPEGRPYDMKITTGTYDFSDPEAIELTISTHQEDLPSGEQSYDKPRRRTNEDTISRSILTLEDEGARKAYENLYPSKLNPEPTEP